jgi:hypothetical protein
VVRDPDVQPLHRGRPSFEGPFDDYNLSLDAGLRATIIGSFFAEAKFELRYDSIPAPGRTRPTSATCSASGGRSEDDAR